MHVTHQRMVTISVDSLYCLHAITLRRLIMLEINVIAIHSIPILDLNPDFYCVALQMHPSREDTSLVGLDSLEPTVIRNQRAQ